MVKQISNRYDCEPGAANQLFTLRRLVAQGRLTVAGSGEEVVSASDCRALMSRVRELIVCWARRRESGGLQSGARQGVKNSCNCGRRRRRPVSR